MNFLKFLMIKVFFFNDSRTFEAAFAQYHPTLQHCNKKKNKKTKALLGHSSFKRGSRSKKDDKTNFP